VNTGDKIDIYLHDAGASVLNQNSLRIEIAPQGLVACYRYRNGEWAAENVSGVKASNTLIGVMGDGRSDTGYLSEMMLPFSALGLSGKCIRFTAVVTDTSSTDTITAADPSKPFTWMMIKTPM
jgi:hypothetical protein